MPVVLIMKHKREKELVAINRQAYYYSNSHQAWFTADKIRYDGSGFRFSTTKMPTPHSGNASHLGDVFQDYLQSNSLDEAVDWCFFENLEQLYVSLRLDNTAWNPKSARLLKQFFKTNPLSNIDVLKLEMKSDNISEAHNKKDLAKWLQRNTDGDYSKLRSDIKKTEPGNSTATSQYRFHEPKEPKEIHYHDHDHYHYHYIHHWNDDNPDRLKASCTIL